MPVIGGSGIESLQSTIAATSAGNPQDALVLPHHPITCKDKLYFDEDGVFSCEHAVAPADDRRTQAACIHSIAILIIELANQL